MRLAPQRRHFSRLKYGGDETRATLAAAAWGARPRPSLRDQLLGLAEWRAISVLLLYAAMEPGRGSMGDVPDGIGRQHACGGGRPKWPRSQAARPQPVAQVLGHRRAEVAEGQQAEFIWIVRKDASSLLADGHARDTPVRAQVRRVPVPLVERSCADMLWMVADACGEWKYSLRACPVSLLLYRRGSFTLGAALVETNWPARRTEHSHAGREAEVVGHVLGRARHELAAATTIAMVLSGVGAHTLRLSYTFHRVTGINPLEDYARPATPTPITRVGTTGRGGSRRRRRRRVRPVVLPQDPRIAARSVSMRTTRDTRSTLVSVRNVAGTQHKERREKNGTPSLITAVTPRPSRV